MGKRIATFRGQHITIIVILLIKLKKKGCIKTEQQRELGKE
jgi:hypothetical protein